MSILGPDAWSFHSRLPYWLSFNAFLRLSIPSWVTTDLSLEAYPSNLSLTMREWYCIAFNQQALIAALWFLFKGPWKCARRSHLKTLGLHVRCFPIPILPSDQLIVDTGYQSCAWSALLFSSLVLYGLVQPLNLSIDLQKIQFTFSYFTFFIIMKFKHQEILSRF